MYYPTSIHNTQTCICLQFCADILSCFPSQTPPDEPMDSIGSEPKSPSATSEPKSQPTPSQTDEEEGVSPSEEVGHRSTQDLEQTIIIQSISE